MITKRTELRPYPNGLGSTAEETESLCSVVAKETAPKGGGVYYARYGMPLIYRLFQKVETHPTGEGCWEWMGARLPCGYGVIKNPNGTTLAHRLLFEMLKGPIPAGLVIDHLCRNRACVNPAHMEPVTTLENIRRGDQGRWAKAKTHCPHGHEYTTENTGLTTRHSEGGRKTRRCLTCARISMAGSRARTALSFGVAQKPPGPKGVVAGIPVTRQEAGATVRQIRMDAESAREKDADLVEDAQRERDGA